MKTGWNEPLCGWQTDETVMIWDEDTLSTYKQAQKERQATLDAKEDVDRKEAEKDGSRLSNDWGFYWLLENDEQYECGVNKHRDGISYTKMRGVKDYPGVYETVCNNCGAVVRLEMIG